MLIILREKDAAASDFGCRDGEIEYVYTYLGNNNTGGKENEGGNYGENDKTAENRDIDSSTGYGIRFGLAAEGDYPVVNIRVALEKGDEEKVAQMLQGNTTRVDAASAERITQNIVKKAADEFSRMMIDYKRMGLHMLPFRVFGMVENAEGELHYPSAQAVILPSEMPPHPEIIASSVQEDTLTLSLRFTVKPQRLKVSPPLALKEGERVRVFVSYPLYIPNAADITGTIGSVRSAVGGNTVGIRFHFLSTSRMKHSVSAPEKYYMLTGNENTGFHLSSKAVELPDYSEYAKEYGYVKPYPIEAMRQTGSGIDPMEWIADWEESEESEERKKSEGGENGYLPKSLPYIYRQFAGADSGLGMENEGVSMEYIERLVSATGCRHILLTRPMTFADAERSRRKAGASGVRKIKIHGLPESDCVAVLLGSDDGVRYGALRVWDPHAATHIFSPRRLWHRLLILGKNKFGDMAIELEKK